MSTRVVATVLAVVIGVVAVGAGAVALLSMDDGAPPGPQGTRGARAPRAASSSAPAGVIAPRSDAAPAPEGGAPWIEPAGYETPLRAIDWSVVGETYAELLPLLRTRARAIARGAAGPPRQRERVDALWAELDELAQPLRATIQTVSRNGVFVHPAFLVNSVAATLHARGRGLTSEQLERLAAAARVADAERLDVDALAADPLLSPAMMAAIEAEARRGLCDDVDDVLGERQRGLLHPAPLTGRVGLDPFRSVEVFRDRLTVLDATDGRAAVAEIVELVRASVGGGDERRDEAIEMASARLLPMVNAFFPEPPRSLDAAGHVKIETCIIAAQSVRDVIEPILALFTGGTLPETPPDVLDRPIILVRAARD